MSKFFGKKNKNFSQGKYNLINKDKYRGSFPIIYRSSLELTAFRYLDKNPNIISWGSESVIIPYKSPIDGRMHRYFVDLVAELKSRDGTIKKLLIEVKPEKQTLPPTISKRKKQSTIIYENTQYAINLAKWEYAKKWAAQKNYIFLILNEKALK
jgi:hypothetical protein